MPPSEDYETGNKVKKELNEKVKDFASSMGSAFSNDCTSSLKMYVKLISGDMEMLGGHLDPLN